MDLSALLLPNLPWLVTASPDVGPVPSMTTNSPLLYAARTIKGAFCYRYIFRIFINDGHRFAGNHAMVPVKNSGFISQLTSPFAGGSGH